MTHVRTVVGRAILPGEGEPQPVTLHIDEAGKITSVLPGNQAGSSADVLWIPDDCVLLPGLVDCHVHLNEPGRTSWEGFQTGTLAAVSGGVTTLIDMPLNSIPPTTTVENLRIKREAAKRVGVSSDLGFWGGIIPGNEGDLVPMLKEGVKGFKCFLIESGVDEFPHVEEEHLVRACDALEGTDALILFHAELGPHDHELAPGNDSQYSTFLESRPASLELSALELILRLARRYRSLRFHIVHLSTAQALPVIRDARRTGVTNLTVETCFHYLLLRAEDIPANATQFKCCPPIREEANRLAICDAVLDGTIDFVVSDHSPCVAELKRGDFMSAWGGISGLGLGLSLLWTDLGERAGLGRLVELLSTAQARQVKLEGVKGALQEGADADFVVFAPEATFEVTLAGLRFKNKVSPYIGRSLRGVVKQTFLRGQRAWDAATGTAERDGQLL